MLNLLAAIICSVSISVLLKIADKYVKNNMVMFLCNYILCCFLAVFYSEGHNPLVISEGWILTVILGTISGVLYIVSFLLVQYGIREFGMMLYSMFRRLGIIVPILIAIIFFGDVPRAVQLVGIIIAIGAFLLISIEKDEKKALPKKSIIGLLSLLLVCGITDAMANIFSELGNPAQKDLYLLATFFVAGLVCLVSIFVKKEHFTAKDCVVGLFIGIPNYFSSRFLILALSEIKAIVVYPVYNSVSLLVLSLIGILVYKEKLDMKKGISLILIIIAIVLLNL